jgi:hypothetical protein
VQRFLIAFEEDVPQSDNNPFSHPGLPKLTQIVSRTLGPLAAASGNFTEQAVPSGAGAIEQLFQYNAELALPFDQDPNTVYWLKIVALDDHLATDPTRIQWGWHNRDYGVHNPLAGTPPTGPGEFDESPVPGFPIWHFQDDAVSGNVNIFLQPGSTLPPDITQDGFTPENYLPGPDLPTAFPTDISKDLAFNLYTIPEPGSVLLMSCAVAALLTYGVRRRRVK